MSPQNISIRLAGVVLLLVSLTGCEILGPEPNESGALSIAVPTGFEPIPVPAHNPLTVEKVDLGERLFFDPVLSRDGTVSCASCHLPELAFADPRPLSIGVDGRTGLRNSPGLANIAYQRLFFWDGGSLTLENQILAPLTDPNEMDADLDTVLFRLLSDPSYVDDFENAFGEGPSLQTLTQAIASFERTIRSGGSRYDTYLAGNDDVLGENEKRGLALFEGKANCASCHNGFLFTSFAFENNGLAFARADSGRARITLDPDDFGKFKVPSLRNVAVTEPYMHDGRLATLHDVLEHYNSGGMGSRGQHPDIRPLDLTSQEINDIVAFLRTLTDDSILAGAGL